MTSPELRSIPGASLGGTGLLVTIENAWLLDLVLGVPIGYRHASPAWLDAVARTPDPPTTFVLGGRALGGVRTLVDDGDPSVAALTTALRARAEAVVDLPPLSVTHKIEPSFGAGLNDYCSLARYYWPNDATSDGLPYVQRDGSVNPAAYGDRFDAERLTRLADRTVLLAIAAYVLRDERYARAAERLVRTWFVDPATRQTPHFGFAQVVPGRSRVRGVGLVEARRYVYVCDAVQLLKHAGYLAADVRAGFLAWLEAFDAWIVTSPQGRHAASAVNNIGFWVDVQRLVYLRALGRTDEAQALVREQVVPRLKDQVGPDGRLERELQRARPEEYVTFTLLALAELAAASEAGLVRLTDFDEAAGQSFQNAFSWFSDTMAANDLGDRVLALQRFVDDQRTIASLRAQAERVAPTMPTEGDPPATPAATPALDREQRDLLEGVMLARAFFAEQGDAVRARTEERDALEDELAAARGKVEATARDLGVASMERDRVTVELEATASDLEAANAERDRVTAELDALSQQLRAVQTDVGQLTADREAAVEAANQRKRERDEAKRKADARIRDLERRLVATTRHLSDLRSSDSWRLTKPLRRGGELVRRLIKRARRRPSDRREAARVPGEAGAEDDAEGQATATPSGAPATAEQPAKPRRRDERPPELAVLHDHTVPNEAALREAYERSALAAEPDTFALVRIIGNDLYPRHKVGQSRENVAFILEHEPELEGCTRAWIVNRIIDPEEEAQVIALLHRHAQHYRQIAFDVDAYAQIGFDHAALPEPGFLASEAFADLEPLMQRRLIAALFRHKNSFVMHNNGARNIALAYARELAKWALPWDGNCFVREDAWRDLRHVVSERPHLPYFVVPMQRIEDNAQLLRADRPGLPVEEPQLVFRRDANERFDERFPYGRRPKVELLWRLGIPGKWDRWRDDPWDQPRNDASADAGAFGVAGWVARLTSGAAHLERADVRSFKNRGRVRQDAIIATLDRLDAGVHGVVPEADSEGLGLVTFEPASLRSAREAFRAGHADGLIHAILAHASEALVRGPYAVTDKTTRAPSGDPHDYWHPAPYWWPNPDTANGLPYVKRDGERVPGTRMYEPDSERYDRTRLQRFFDDTTALALAGFITERDDYLQRGAAFVRRWFLDPSSRMNPHLRYAQVRMGHRDNEGSSFGIIEMKDLYYVLDAVRLLGHSGALGAAELESVRDWLDDYRHWLHTSEQGRAERRAVNNHGTYYDLHTAAVSAFLGDHAALRDVFLRAEGRIEQQFDEAGEQPHERSRPISAHYYLFNLQGWLHLFQLGARYGFVPAALDPAPFERFALAVRRFFELAAAEWPYAQRGGVDWERVAAVASTLLRLGHAELVPERWRTLASQQWWAMKPVFDPHDGVQPYWNLVWMTPPAERGALRRRLEATRD